MKDINTKNLKSRNKGSVERETKLSEHDGDLMSLASKDVITVPPTTTIKDTAQLMIDNEFRRIPVTDPGSGKLLGIVTCMDIINFLGGGDKYNIIKYKCNDNYLSAINEPIKEIMTRGVITMNHKSTIRESVKVMVDNHVGAMPIVDKEDKLVGIVTERDFALSLAGVLTDQLVQDYMTTDVITITPGTSFDYVTKFMVRNSFRRLPIVSEDENIPEHTPEKLVGIVTSTDILRYFIDKKFFSQMKTNSAEELLGDLKISEVMSKGARTVEPLTRLGDFSELLKEKNIGGVPVVKNDKVLGIITERDILKAINDS
ncbi:MAG: CBS domain-containing protein [Methanobrevibacter boviskoreani]|jgi:CBS domain-containing protein|uniref:CBS domain-containing protein n=1 Tax=Methanobrevibacter TaxID=2172 RepID=UPI000334847D|nr:MULTISPECIES: CBS domain-containing protein [Methanobrevibacter]AGN17437.1 CBS domain-containing protein [Methanobrevibacter sp. AbM4]MCI6775283.1 CBS domain-containing protein [Methanobrevibacter boviskoreani]MCI6930443.1 CBS domain-containing protein [Methanobrevibacter boviskoreani]MDD6256831.1 CBS domain-containing protein [Methanobrevibacter boviskoreani]